MARKAAMEPREPAEEAGAQPGMQALLRGLRILNLVAQSDSPMRFTALLEATGLPKGTLHRILHTLIDERYLVLKESDQTYVLGSKPFQLAHRVWDQFDLRGAAEPELDRLAELTGEAVRLGILDGDKVLYIDQRDLPRQIRLANGIGSRSSIHATALGKAMAAHLTAAERQRLLTGVDLESFTDQTIVQAGDLDQQLNIIKARGYAISIGEQHDDVSGVAAAILDHRARPLGAIGIVGPSYRLPAETLHSYGREVIEAARRISGNIGELAMSIAVNPRPLDLGGDVRCVIPGEDFLGEGPFWDADAGRLHWVDILAPGVVSGDPVTGERSFRAMNELIGVAIPRAKGGFVCATETGIKLMDDKGDISVLATPEEDRPGNRFNDGKCDAKGRLWVGSLAINTEPGRGRLWRIEGDGASTMMEDQIHIANGLGWSPDNRTFYFTDSGARTIWAHDFDLEAGTLSNRRAFVTFDPGDGVPDGMTVDAEGGVWTTLWDGWAVRRYHADGTLDRSISVPVPRPTSCTFGGPQGETLFVTSARIRLSAKQLSDAPLSGSVFAIETGLKGQPDRPFAG
ncbi:SMP-30/gluconolactonase/LRE family protein [Oceanomicrobium pacificus]|uniref:Helix-turn-helix domain-containing protein n=1 Tax=Oceanomicrobium pacificus TaxID=2692916 RepID=A0A6B0TKN0_9RHOB|nr:SMP-30/gluconolactonase/LRE family protein [Oceanomicrobium pacificus]MXU65070.1 helix-turn-helix domain-containing protein [Oceanomicrobium pacificus]